MRFLSIFLLNVIFFTFGAFAPLPDLKEQEAGGLRQPESWEELFLQVPDIRDKVFSYCVDHIRKALWEGADAIFMGKRQFNSLLRVAHINKNFRDAAIQHMEGKECYVIRWSDFGETTGTPSEILESVCKARKADDTNLLEGFGDAQIGWRTLFRIDQSVFRTLQEGYRAAKEGRAVQEGMKAENYDLVMSVIGDVSVPALESREPIYWELAVRCPYLLFFDWGHDLRPSDFLETNREVVEPSTPDWAKKKEGEADLPFPFIATPCISLLLCEAEIADWNKVCAVHPKLKEAVHSATLSFLPDEDFSQTMESILTEMPNCRSLTLEGDRLSVSEGAGTLDGSKLKQITDLKIYDLNLERVENFPHLLDLHIQNSEIGSLLGLDSLGELFLSNVSGMKSVEGFPALRVADISACEDLECLKLSELQELAIGSEYFAPDDSDGEYYNNDMPNLVLEAKNLPNLLKLTIAGGTLEDSEEHAFSHITKLMAFHNLQEVTISDWPALLEISDVPKLQKLKVDDCPNLEVSEELKKVEECSIYFPDGCVNVSALQASLKSGTATS